MTTSLIARRVRMVNHVKDGVLDDTLGTVGSEHHHGLGVLHYTVILDDGRKVARRPHHTPGTTHQAPHPKRHQALSVCEVGHLHAGP